MPPPPVSSLTNAPKGIGLPLRCVNVIFALAPIRGLKLARTMTVDVGEELREFIDSLVKAGDYRTQSEVMRDALRLLREKQAESRLQELRDLLAEGLSSGDAKPWNKDAFLKNVRGRVANERD